MAATEDAQQKWLSSKLEASLMEALDEKAKGIGLSRSEAVRKAVKQWVEGSSAEPAASDGSNAEIIERLDRIESRISGSGHSESHSENDEAHSEESSGSSENSPETHEDGEESLEQIEMYEGEDLLNWIDSESEKSEGSQTDQR